MKKVKEQCLRDGTSVKDILAQFKRTRAQVEKNANSLIAKERRAAKEARKCDFYVTGTVKQFFNK